MANEKLFTAKQAANAVLEKVAEILKQSELAKSERGVHGTQHHLGLGGGISAAGYDLREGKMLGDSSAIKNAKQMHVQKLGELKAMPKPNLPKSEDMEKKYEGFKAVEESAQKSGASDPAAVAAAVGRKKYGKHAFQEAAAEGHKMGKGEDGPSFKPDPHSEGHMSKVAAPEHPEAGKASHPSKCPACGHPSPSTGEGTTLPRSKAQEDWMEKYETENSKKLGYKLSEAGKETGEPEKSDHAFEVEGEKSKKSSDDARLAQQKDPQHNAKEQAEGNNELAGTTPTQVGQDGKNMPGYDEMKGKLKLAKFIGMKGYKRTKSLESSQSQSGAEAQHKESIKGK